VTYLILTCYALLAYVTIVRLRHINLRAISFVDGVLVGLTFYIVIPMFFIMAQGYIFSIGIMLPAYQPFIDIYTTINIFMGWGVVLLLHVFSSARVDYQVNHDPVYLLKIMSFLYFIFSLYSYFKSGMGAADAHWHESLIDTLAESTSLIIFKNFAFAYRTMLFGLIYYVFNVGRITGRTAVLFGGGLALFDMLLTYNRITIVYFYFLFFLVYSRYWLSILVGTVLLLPVVMLFSNFWTVFRGAKQGSGLDSVVNAVYLAGDIFRGDQPFIIQMNGIFESSNIIVLNYVVKNVGGEFPALWGATFIVRPLTTFLPSSIWSGKPKVFGTYLGKYINNHDTLTLNSTLFGEVIGNFYYVWPIMLFVVLYIVNRIFNFMGSFIPGTGFMAFFVAIGLWRFDMNFASACIYALILVFVVGQIISRARK